MTTIASRIMDLVKSVRRDEYNFGVLSTGEQIAVALVLNRADMLTPHGTILEAIDRLGRPWSEAALQVQREIVL